MEGRLKSGTVPEQAWPVWAKRAVTLAVLWHAAAVWAGAWGAAPASELQRRVADFFQGYNVLVDQGYSYRYYSPEPPPTPVVTARIKYKDGRPDEETRIPDRSLRPRLRYQRQLALANALAADFQAAREGLGDGSRSRWALAYARHIGRLRPGASTVTLFVKLHKIPDLPGFSRILHETGKAPDLDADEYFTTPERIGEFPCDAS